MDGAHWRTRPTSSVSCASSRAPRSSTISVLPARSSTRRPRRTVGEVFEAHRAAFVRHGSEHALLPACGYTMGATWPPTWMEQPQIFANSPAVLEPDMAFFTHMILIDHSTGLTMSLGEQ